MKINHHYKLEQECKYFIQDLNQVQQQFIAKLIASKGLSVKRVSCLKNNTTKLEHVGALGLKRKEI